MNTLPQLLEWEKIHQRLTQIFPEGLTNRNYLTREMSAKTIFVMLYIGAIEGSSRWVKPDQVTRMTDKQAEKTGKDQRNSWTVQSVKPSKQGILNRWYAPNTREPIRDETLRQGLIEYGAVIERKDLPTTSPKGRYALRQEFASLFDPTLTDSKLAKQVDDWRKNCLSPSALARAHLLRKSTVETGAGVLVTYPNKETRRLAPGSSSHIIKAVVEQFAPKFLNDPGVLWLSESANIEDRRDSELTRLLGLQIEKDRNLPDLILVDLESNNPPLFVFVEAVASDGPITETRKTALLSLITSAGYEKSQAAFLTAYQDRSKSEFKKTFPALAWQSFAWCMSEPDKIIGLHDHHKTNKLQDFMITEQQ